MSLLICIFSALVYSPVSVQLIGGLYENSSDPSDVQNDELNDPNCPRVEVSRIANGYNAKEGQYPFIVALIRRNNHPKVSDQYCAGSLLTFDVVITACHCLVEGDKSRIHYPHNMIDPHSVDISAGTVDLNNYITRRMRGSAKYGQIRRGMKAVVHPKCSRNENKITHDFGLLKADRPFSSVPVFIKAQIKPLNVSKKYNPKHMDEVDEMAKNHTACVTMGWGVDVRGKSHNILQMLNTTMRPGDWCAGKIKNLTTDQDTGPDIFIPITQICVVGCGKRQTICGNDGGGPLICDKTDKEKYFVGVVSFGPGFGSCGEDESPLVYARTDGNDLWIWATIAGLAHDGDPKSIAPVPASLISAAAVMSSIIVIKDALRRLC